MYNAQFDAPGNRNKGAPNGQENQKIENHEEGSKEGIKKDEKI